MSHSLERRPRAEAAAPAPFTPVKEEHLWRLALRVSLARPATLVAPEHAAAADRKFDTLK
jgi:hypothetical protein